MHDKRETHFLPRAGVAVGPKGAAKSNSSEVVPLDIGPDPPHSRTLEMFLLRYLTKIFIPYPPHRHDQYLHLRHHDGRQTGVVPLVLSLLPPALPPSLLSDGVTELWWCLCR